MIRNVTGLPGSLQWLHHIWLTSVLRQVICHNLCSFDYATASEVKRTGLVLVFTEAETHLYSGPSSHKAGIPCLWVFFPPRGHQLHLWAAVLWVLRKLTHPQSSSLKACYSQGGGALPLEHQGYRRIVTLLGSTFISSALLVEVPQGQVICYVYAPILFLLWKILLKAYLWMMNGSRRLPDTEFSHQT